MAILGANTQSVVDRLKRERDRFVAFAFASADILMELDPKGNVIYADGATKKLLEKTKRNIGDIDLFEINEAFAVVAMAAIKQLELDPKRVNIHGGACALGHPIGASGTRILVTLLHALQRQQKTRGIAALCIGGGEGTAIAIEII